jgi:hypothetical protein
MNFDSIMLDSNAIFQLQGFIPTKDNLSGIQQFFDEGGAREELADADLFLLELAKVSFLSLRLKAFELMQQFELKYHESKQVRCSRCEKGTKPDLIVLSTAQGYSICAECL